ncbi:hypothetical protein ACRS7F_22935 [Brucella anthropi]|uniref:hypothetical protein n=1 Tax=Brucella anthropi TaxID=529 RepID=UPI003EE1C40A
MTKEQKIAYVVHPVSAKMKQSLRENGMKIVDARFAPEDAKIINPHKKREKAPARQSQATVNGIGTDSGDQFSDGQLFDIIEKASGTRPHQKTGRAKLIEIFNSMNADVAKDSGEG